LERYQPAIAGLCRKYGVRPLELFGSAARGGFDPERSDLDFLVLYADEGGQDLVDRYLGLRDALGQLLGRPVDLVDIRAARNPYLIAEALKHRVRLYAA
jgi:hypothetical protein